MGGTTGTDTGLVQGVPLAARAQHEEDGIHGPAIIDAWTMTPERMGLAWRKEGLDARPQFVGEAPIPADFLIVVTH
jgi:hypothetical protein